MDAPWVPARNRASMGIHGGTMVRSCAGGDARLAPAPSVFYLTKMPDLTHAA